MKTNNPFPQPICDQIWNGKYRLITPNPNIQDDQSVEDTWKRIASACAETKPTLYGDMENEELPVDYHETWFHRFLHALEDFKFLPAGRITAGAGSGRNVTLFNCYVMGKIPDDMAGIFEMLKEAALTMQQGGGIGYDFTPLRPRNSPVKGVDADASGPITFMDVWDAMCRTIMSAGSRRGAMMATMRCDHPDIEEFITAKRDSNRLRMFNVSVLASDKFMSAVKDDDDWPLIHEHRPAEPVEWAGVTMIGGKHIYKVVRAKELWNLIMESTFNYAEPGVLFIDRINTYNNLWYLEDITATNPCGEQPLPPYGACLLGSINLVKFVKDAFTDDSSVDLEELERIVRIAVRMLDSVIDHSLFPLPQQREEAMAKRRMGLGVTGLADMLFMMNLTYGSPEAAEFAEEIMKTIAIVAYEESIEMAKEFGPCPVTSFQGDRESFIQSGFMAHMPQYIRDGVLEHGIRNALLTSIAPTGTISLYAGNVSSGVEPIFAPAFTRKVLENDGSKREELVEDYAIREYREFRENNGMDVDPDYSESGLVTAQDLSPMAHVVMQASVQKWVDSSISKTINCPEDISFDDFQDVYMTAWETGCKGCTTYRPNDVTGSVLSVENSTDKGEPEKEEGPEEPTPSYPPASSQPYGRPQELTGQTYKLKWENSNVYVTINNSWDQYGNVMPFEIFINSKKMEHFQWTVALTRMISAVFRRGGDITFVTEELKNVFDPNGGAWTNGKYVPSFIALLGQTIEQHLFNIGYGEGADDFFATAEPEENADEIKFDGDNVPVGKPDQCSECGGFNVVRVSGCPTCNDCGHSKCG